MAKLTREYFEQPTLALARDLIGKMIVRVVDGHEIEAMITEVEAYKGPRDRASHTYGSRRTKRVEPLYGDAGTLYVYLCYGIHWLVNVATAPRGAPECVLIRAVASAEDGAMRLHSGPGRVSRHLQMDKRLDGVDATRSTQVRFEDRGLRVPARGVNRGPRIGIAYAGSWWAARAWRFWIDAETARTVLAQSDRLASARKPRA